MTNTQNKNKEEEREEKSLYSRGKIVNLLRYLPEIQKTITSERPMVFLHPIYFPPFLILKYCCTVTSLYVFGRCFHDNAPEFAERLSLLLPAATLRSTFYTQGHFYSIQISYAKVNQYLYSCIPLLATSRTAFHFCFLLYFFLPMTNNSSEGEHQDTSPTELGKLF